MASARSTYRYLIEVWAEPRDIDGLPVLLRGRVRDLANRRERYVTSAGEVGAMIEQFLDADGLTPRVWEAEG